jgi:hypothetical protein
MSGAWYQFYVTLGFAAEIAVAAAAFWRFRLTPSGWLIGGTFSTWTALAVLSRLLASVVPDPRALTSFYQATRLLSLPLLLAVAAGVALIPVSLDRLDR